MRVGAGAGIAANAASSPRLCWQQGATSPTRLARRARIWDFEELEARADAKPSRGRSRCGPRVPSPLQIRSRLRGSQRELGGGVVRPISRRRQLVGRFPVSVLLRRVSRKGAEGSLPAWVAAEGLRCVGVQSTHHVGKASLFSGLSGDLVQFRLGCADTLPGVIRGVPATPQGGSEHPNETR